jgi:hypothetical protein
MEKIVADADARVARRFKELRGAFVSIGMQRRLRPRRPPHRLAAALEVDRRGGLLAVDFAAEESLVDESRRRRR